MRSQSSFISPLHDYIYDLERAVIRRRHLRDTCALSRLVSLEVRRNDLQSLTGPRVGISISITESFWTRECAERFKEERRMMVDVFHKLIEKRAPFSVNIESQD